MPELPKIAFLDFEASSLGKYGYPIEVAWVFASGEEESHLIRPDASWIDWDPKAEAVHGISKEQLRAEGMPLDHVAQRMISVLTGYTLYATAPSWDGKWLSKLLRKAGLPRHALRLEDTDLAQRRVVRETLHAVNIPVHLHRDIMKETLVQAQRSDDELGAAAHRALADARREQRLWLDVKRRTEDIAAQLRRASAESIISG